MSKLVVIDHFVIHRDGQYNSFPNAIRKDNGEVMVMFRQAPDRRGRFPGNSHIDPKSKAVCAVSADDGKTWEEKARVVHDDYCFGVQDPCLNVLRDGTLFCTFFTWQLLLKPDVPVLNPATYDRIIADRWVARLGGAFTLRSADGGETWDEPLPVIDPVQGAFARNIRGNIVELDDGSILLPMYIRESGSSIAIVAVTKDRGQTWSCLARLAEVEDHMFHEPNLFRTASGKLVAWLRTTDNRADVPKERKHPLYTSESHDNGRTWGNVRRHDIYSPSPFHALQLRSGKVLLTYGHRYPSYGIRAYVLNGECTNLEEAQEIILREDGLGTDIGYTSSVQLGNGDILVTYYYYDEAGDRYIAGTLCREIE